MLVVARIGWQPSIVGSDVGTTPIFNWILYGYGVPAASFWVAGRLLRRRADDTPCRMVEIAAILFTVLLANLEIRHFMNGGDIYGLVRSPLGETGLQVCVWLAMAIGLEHIRAPHRKHRPRHRRATARSVELLGIVFGLCIFANPWSPTSRSEPGCSTSSCLATAYRRCSRHRARHDDAGVRPNFYRVIAAATAVLLALSYLSLRSARSIRARVPRPWADQRARSNTPTRSSGSPTAWRCCCSASVQRSQPARLASAAVTLLTIAKVFLVDTAGLTGIYRALSLIGLGAVLVGIAWLYQHWLFPRTTKTAPAPGPSGAPT